MIRYNVFFDNIQPDNFRPMIVSEHEISADAARQVSAEAGLSAGKLLSIRA
ncbi:MAG TPA: hypothetical protein VGB68_01520 [Pyrinomonadaceae bacterium]|jgi:hypothetical protein